MQFILNDESRRCNGALAVTRKGPMEGIFPLAEVRTFAAAVGKSQP